LRIEVVPRHRKPLLSMLRPRVGAHDAEPDDSELVSHDVSVRSRSADAKQLIARPWHHEPSVDARRPLREIDVAGSR
jgi:hypothetical protein